VHTFSERENLFDSATHESPRVRVTDSSNIEIGNKNWEDKRLLDLKMKHSIARLLSKVLKLQVLLP
jgi:hypothetical protein